MICPQCGYDMGSKNKCIRCGFEAKELSVIDEEHEQKHDEPDVKVIDPCNVYLTHPYGYEDYYDEPEDPFDTLMNQIFGDPISDLLGGLFGMDFGMRQSRPDVDPPRKTEKKTGPVYVVDDVEIIGPDGERLEKDETQPKKPHKIRDMFKRNKKQDGESN